MRTLRARLPAPVRAAPRPWAHSPSSRVGSRARDARSARGSARRTPTRSTPRSRCRSAPAGPPARYGGAARGPRRHARCRTRVPRAATCRCRPWWPGDSRPRFGPRPRDAGRLPEVGERPAIEGAPTVDRSRGPGAAPVHRDDRMALEQRGCGTGRECGERRRRRDVGARGQNERCGVAGVAARRHVVHRPRSSRTPAVGRRQVAV